MHRLIGTFVLLLLIFGIASPPTRAEEGEPDGAAAQLARGAKSWSDNCGQCHNVRDPGDLSDRQWDVVVTHMQIRANLTGEEARDVLAFLQASN